MVLLYVACWLDDLCSMESLHTSQVAHQADTYLLFQQHEATRSMFSPPLDGMLVHCRVIPSINFAGTCLCTWMEKGTERVTCKCLAQEHNTMSLTRAQTCTTWSGQGCEPTNYEPGLMVTGIYWLAHLRAHGLCKSGLIINLLWRYISWLHNIIIVSSYYNSCLDF